MPVFWAYAQNLPGGRDPWWFLLLVAVGLWRKILENEEPSTEAFALTLGCAKMILQLWPVTGAARLEY